MDNQHVATEQVKPMSLAEKVTNIFASPGELFENVRLTPRTNSNWVVPLVIFMIMAIVLGQLVIHNASLADQMGAIIKKGFETRVQEGQMTQAQADQTYETFAKPGSTVFTITQIATGIIGPPLALFVLALVYWLLGRWAMKGTAPYMKLVEVIGLTFFISVLEQVVTTMMMFAMDSMYATPSLGLFVSEYNLENKLHVALSKINVFTVWNLAVVSVGLSKIFQRDFPKVLVLVFALWIVWSLVSVLTGVRFFG